MFDFWKHHQKPRAQQIPRMVRTDFRIGRQCRLANIVSIREGSQKETVRFPPRKPAESKAPGKAENRKVATKYHKGPVGLLRIYSGKNLVPNRL